MRVPTRYGGARVVEGRLGEKHGMGCGWGVSGFGSEWGDPKDGGSMV